MRPNPRTPRTPGRSAGFFSCHAGPARRASRKLLERIVEQCWPFEPSSAKLSLASNPRGLQRGNALSIFSQVRQAGRRREAHLRVQPGGVPRDRVRRQEVAHPQFPFKGWGAYLVAARTGRIRAGTRASERARKEKRRVTCGCRRRWPLRATRQAWRQTAAPGR